MHPSLPIRAALLLAALLCAASCERKAPPATDAAASSTPDSQGVSFGTGFHKEEAVPPAGAMRWVRQDATVHVQVPADGHYRLTFRPFTVFAKVENTIEVRAGGQAAGTIATHAYDMSSATTAFVEASLHSGVNDLALHSTQPEIRLGENDDRMAAFGLLLPITVERLP